MKCYIYVFFIVIDFIGSICLREVDARTDKSVCLEKKPYPFPWDKVFCCCLSFVDNNFYPTLLLIENM